MLRPSWKLLCVCVLAGACRRDMHDTAYFEPFEASDFFADGRVTRPQVPGTIARGELMLDDVRTTGRDADGELATTVPLPITRELLERGRQRFEINCAPCHDRLGYGDGLVVQRGMTQPPSLHIDRLRTAPVGYVFDVATNGFGAMYDVADRVTIDDRWAIAAWVRVLQLSQNASLEDVPSAERARLEATR